MGSSKGRTLWPSPHRSFTGWQDTRPRQQSTTFAALGPVLFDVVVTAYYRSLDAEDWSGVWQYGALLEQLHVIAERGAA